MNNVVEVVAAVIADARGRVLLARRTEGRDLAGLWEFPGGKREPGETPEAALARELHEELGIVADVGATVILVPHRYPHKRLRLDVRRVDSWDGTPKGLDGQALAWVPPHKLASYAMPGADRPVVAALLQPDRYLVTPTATEAGGDNWLAALQRSISGTNIRRVQLRGVPAAFARDAVALCRTAGVEVLVNADIAMARELDVGVHLKAAQLAGMLERPLKASLPVAASCHDADDLAHAERLRCDFAVLGPLQSTPTHPGTATLGWAAFAALREHSTIPLYAIGGLTMADLPAARAHGAQGIAAIRALWSTAP